MSLWKVAISEVAVYSVRDKLIEIYRIYTTDRIYHTIQALPAALENKVCSEQAANKPYSSVFNYSVSQSDSL